MPLPLCEEAGAELVPVLDKEVRVEALEVEAADDAAEDAEDATDEAEDTAELAADDAEDTAEEAAEEAEAEAEAEAEVEAEPDSVEEAEPDELALRQEEEEPAITSKGALLLVAPVLSRI